MASKKDTKLVIKVDASSQFAKELIKYLQKGKVKFEVIPATDIPEADKIKFLSARITSRILTERIANILIGVDFEYIFQIAAVKEEWFRKIRNFGEISVDDLRVSFAENGLEFGNVPHDLLDKAEALARS